MRLDYIWRIRLNNTCKHNKSCHKDSNNISNISISINLNTCCRNSRCRANIISSSTLAINNHRTTNPCILTSNSSRMLFL